MPHLTATVTAVTYNGDCIDRVQVAVRGCNLDTYPDNFCYNIEMSRGEYIGLKKHGFLLFAQHGCAVVPISYIAIGENRYLRTDDNDNPKDDLGNVFTDHVWTMYSFETLKTNLRICNIYL